MNELRGESGGVPMSLGGGCSGGGGRKRTGWLGEPYLRCSMGSCSPV